MRAVALRLRDVPEPEMRHPPAVVAERVRGPRVDGLLAGRERRAVLTAHQLKRAEAVVGHRLGRCGLDGRAAVRVRLAVCPCVGQRHAQAPPQSDVVGVGLHAPAASVDGGGPAVARYLRRAERPVGGRVLRVERDRPLAWSRRAAELTLHDARAAEQRLRERDALVVGDSHLGVPRDGVPIRARRRDRGQPAVRAPVGGGELEDLTEDRLCSGDVASVEHGVGAFERAAEVVLRLGGARERDDEREEDAL